MEHPGRDGYSFLTKSAKLKQTKNEAMTVDGYSFLTKSAKLKPVTEVTESVTSYSFLTKSAKLKHFYVLSQLWVWL